jgi:predicted P-loop ATPase
MLKTIKALARAGVSVIPVRKNDKAPTQSNWSELKTLTPEQVDKESPRWHNYGIRPGAHSKLRNGDQLATIDLDIKDASVEDEALAKLRELIPEIDEFAVVSSGNKLGLSRHYVGSTNKPLRSRRLWAHPEKVLTPDGKKDKAQIDIIGTGKQHVGPGSMHPDGYEYEIKNPEDFYSMLDDWANGTRSHYISSSAFDIDDREDGPKTRKKIESLDDIVDHGPVEMSDDEIDGVLRNLPCERIDDYQSWLELGMALHHQFPDDPDYALELWHWVSKKSDKYDAEVLDDKWETIKDDKGTASITFRSLIKEANDIRRNKAADEALDGVEDEEADEEQKKADKKAEWRKQLQIDTNGAFKGTLPNIMLILRNDPRTRGRLAFNTFTNRIVIRKSFGDLPHGQFIKCTDKVNGTLWVDAHDHIARTFLESRRKDKGWGLKCADRDLVAAISNVANENSFHPVREYLDRQKWDGVKRFDRMFIDYFGAPDNKYTRQASRLFALGAVARIYEPGHKFDFVPIFEGLQGKRKSTFIETLAVDAEWAGSLSASLKDEKKAVESMAGKWILEIPELSGFKRADVQTIKHFISSNKDNARLSYDRRAQDFQRQCVFMGTTNESKYLLDESGNRRFWPIPTNVEAIDLERLIEERDQIWAEAVEAYFAMRKKFPVEKLHYLPLYIKDPEALAIAQAEQADRMEDSTAEAWAQDFERWLNTPINHEFDNLDDPSGGQDEYRMEVTLRDVYCGAFERPPETFVREIPKIAAAAMKLVPGWEVQKNPVHVYSNDGVRTTKRVWRRTKLLQTKKRRDLLG